MRRVGRGPEGPFATAAAPLPFVRPARATAVFASVRAAFVSGDVARVAAFANLHSPATDRSLADQAAGSAREIAGRHRRARSAPDLRPPARPCPDFRPRPPPPPGGS